MLTQCCLPLGWPREHKGLLALSFKNKKIKLNRKKLAHKSSYNTAWTFTADVNTAYGKWQDQFSVQGFALLHSKLPADPCDWRSGLLRFCMNYKSQEAHLHRPVPEAASLKASKSPAPPLHGHKRIKKLIHELSWLTVLPHANIHVYIFKQSNRCHWLITREQGWEHTALLLLPVNSHLNVIHGRVHHTAVSYTEQHTHTAMACLCHCPHCCRYHAPENQPGVPYLSVQTWSNCTQ